MNKVKHSFVVDGIEWRLFWSDSKKAFRVDFDGSPDSDWGEEEYELRSTWNCELKGCKTVVDCRETLGIGVL
jgi:hypothetical protein